MTSNAKTAPMEQDTGSTGIAAVLRSAPGLLAIVSLGTALFGAAFYMGSERGGGAKTQELSERIATMSAEINAANRQNQAETEEIRRLNREVAALQVTAEKLRTEMETERRARDAEWRRAMAEAEWLRQQVIELRAGFPRRQSGDSEDRGQDMHPSPDMPVDMREALIPFSTPARVR